LKAQQASWACTYTITVADLKGSHSAAYVLKALDAALQDGPRELVVTYRNKPVLCFGLESHMPDAWRDRVAGLKELSALQRNELSLTALYRQRQA
jgi:hypothetical protein